ncbi:hypothetical protein Sa4125_29080 [Aureimonas sp. SA4125]|uniref:hypothetical protein n=1 Tax=Aureimonas sp. SA4125 TaxID=2826993 RepID=UPI001CC47D31|nr:hypothetical protein [Aureimonas sp. SA4125]BDA85366.1 hypothetical protein Sa4125_29080 [Aureimonas sp. SA4125]
MPADEKPALRDEIIDAVEDEEALLKSRIERFGSRVWRGLLAAARSLRGAPASDRHAPFWPKSGDAENER